MSAAEVDVWHRRPTGGIAPEGHEPGDYTRTPIVVGDTFLFGPLEGETEVGGGDSPISNAIHAAQRSDGQVADGGQVYVDQNGNIRRGFDDDHTPEVRRTVEVYDPVSGAFLLCETDGQGCVSSHSCCVADGRTRPTVGDLGGEEPLCNWSSYELISAFDHMEPHSNVPTTPAHMATAVALHREIVARAAKQDEAILNSVAGSWRNYGEAEGKLYLVGGGPADAGQGSIDLVALRDALLRAQSRQDQMPELPATAYRSGSPSEGEL